MGQAVLDYSILGLSVMEWGSLLLIWVGTAGVLLGLKRLIVGRFVALAKRTSNHIDDVVAVILKGTRRSFVIVVALLLAVAVAQPDATARGVIERIVLLAAMVQVGLWGNDLIKFFSALYIERQGESGGEQMTAVRAVGVIGRLVLWSILFVLALDNFGVDITALVAGLGIGGIAIALAVQNVLQDLLAYISIVVDKPFVYGDFVVLDDHVGSVEHIGIKSTRLRSLSGEQLVFSNSDLLSSRLRNFKRMYERRIAFTTGVTYDTSRERLERIPGLIRSAVEGLEDVRFDRSHLKAFDDYAITFETVYYVTVPDYAVFMDRQQSINLGIHAAFESEGIEFAFPTQTIHVVSEGEADD
jgi:small-conductance mechanosensitive channel